MEVFRKCSQCKIEYPTINFHKNKSTKDGYHLLCKTCKKDYYLKNKDKLFPKLTCICGKIIYKYYLEKHFKTKYHNQNDDGIIKVWV
jgi:hypothetical protein